MQIQMNMYLRSFNSDMIEVKIKLIKDVINVDIPSAIIIPLKIYGFILCFIDLFALI